jgi:hypothetical protein
MARHGLAFRAAAIAGSLIGLARNSRGVVARPWFVRHSRAIGTAEYDGCGRNAVADDRNATMRTTWGKSMNRTLETVERVVLTCHNHFEGVRVRIATAFAFCHRPLSWHAALLQSFDSSGARGMPLPIPKKDWGDPPHLRVSERWYGVCSSLATMLDLRSAAKVATAVALLSCRYDDRPPAVAPSEPANPAQAPEPRVPAPDFPPERSEVDLDPGPGTGPVASVIGIGGAAGTGGVGGTGGTGGLSGSSGAAATHPQPIH